MTITLTSVLGSQTAELHDTSNKVKYTGKVEPLERSKIIFHGLRNLVVVEDGARLQDSTLQLFGNDAIVYISKSKWPILFNANIFNDSVLFLGENCSFNGKLQLSLSERKHIVISADCMFAYGISIRTSDPHLVYSAQTSERTNLSKSVIIGEHVWIGEDVRLLKGSCVGSGSLIGVRSVVTGSVPANRAIVGIPGKAVGDNIFWHRPSVHSYTPEQTEFSMTGNPCGVVFDECGQPEALLELVHELEAKSSQKERYEWCKDFANNCSRVEIMKNQEIKGQNEKVKDRDKSLMPRLLSNFLGRK